jgi:hypothetical protein
MACAAFLGSQTVAIAKQFRKELGQFTNFAVCGRLPALYLVARGSTESGDIA